MRKKGSHKVPCGEGLWDLALHCIRGSLCFRPNARSHVEYPGTVAENGTGLDMHRALDDGVGVAVYVVEIPQGDCSVFVRPVPLSA